MKLRIEKRLPLAIDLYKWHVFFALWPRRLDSQTVVWLENIARRKMHVDSYARTGPVRANYPLYTYGPISNVLTQPGVTLDVDVAAQQSQSTIFTPLGPIARNACGGISAAQAGGTAFPGGSLGNPGQGGQNLPLQGTAHVGPTPPGGHNKASPKP